jgi:urea carboxylase
VVHLPLSWDDPACRTAIDKYMTTVRRDAMVPEQPRIYPPD